MRSNMSDAALGTVLWFNCFNCNGFNVRLTNPVWSQQLSSMIIFHPRNPSMSMNDQQECQDMDKGGHMVTRRKGTSIALLEIRGELTLPMSIGKGAVLLVGEEHNRGDDGSGVLPSCPCAHKTKNQKQQ